jgi:hypothetical protein
MARPVTFPLLFMVVEGCWLGRSPPKDLGLARPISLEGLLIDRNMVVRSSLAPPRQVGETFAGFTCMPLFLFDSPSPSNPNFLLSQRPCGLRSLCSYCYY